MTTDMEAAVDAAAIVQTAVISGDIMKKYNGKTFLISGGSSGIGLALAKQAFSYGANVWILARTLNKLKTAQEEINKFRVNSNQCLGLLTADVTNEREIERSVNELAEANVPIDYLINSAGVAHPGIITELEADIYHWMMDVNYFGTVNLTRAVLQPMLARGSGHIVNISSVAGFLSIHGYAAYSGSKFAVRGFSDALRAELKPLGLQVSIAFPPDTDTPQLVYENKFKPEITVAIEKVAGQKLSTPEFVADQILRGVARGKYIILPGSDSSVVFWATSLAGSLTYPLLDWVWKRAHDRLRKSKNGRSG